MWVSPEVVVHPSALAPVALAKKDGHQKQKQEQEQEQERS